MLRPFLCSNVTTGCLHLKLAASQGIYATPVITRLQSAAGKPATPGTAGAPRAQRS